MSTALHRALKAIREAEAFANAQMVRDYPTGSRVNWDGKYGGEVIAHGHGMRLKVRNIATDREYWIHAYRVT